MVRFGMEAAMRRTAELGLMLALALILSYVESMIPFSFGIPGIKLGLPALPLCSASHIKAAARSDWAAPA